MPAVRSRTQNWRQSLESLAERGGSIELALPGAIEGDPGPTGGRSESLIWRVRVLDVQQDAIVLERPVTLGKPVPLKTGVNLVGIISIGQNRWMFRTKLNDWAEFRLNGSRVVTGAVVDAPETVERCQRRSFYRVGTIGLDLPNVTVSVVHDTAMLEPLETANREHVLELQRRGVVGRLGIDEPEFDETVHGTGVSAKATLLNMGGGGVGLLFHEKDQALVEMRKPVWMRIEIPPFLPAPIEVAGRIRHTHTDSERRVYAGVSFTFAPGTVHEQFIADQLCRCVAMIQRDQMSRAIHPDEEA